MPVFIILHYLSTEMTVQCVDTLRRIFDGQAFHIVIVDNGSPNGSGAVLFDKYACIENCTVLLSSENLGFAKGNNLGCVYATDNLDPEYLIVMNNDVLVEDPDFFTKIRKTYEETDFYVLGPDIYACAADFHQNPISVTGYTQQQVRQIIRKRKQWLAIYPLHFWWRFISQKAKKTVGHLLGRKPSKRDNPLSRMDRLNNPVLHGACYVFSRNFMSVRKEPFVPDTFLYFEEDILHYICTKNNYLMIYDSSVQVKHLEDVSTNLAFKSEYRKRRMKYRNLIASASVLLKQMTEGV